MKRKDEIMLHLLREDYDFAFDYCKPDNSHLTYPLHASAVQDDSYPKHPDKGCEYADLFFGCEKGEYRCVWCPFGDCIYRTPRSARLKDLCPEWQDFARLIYKYRKPTVEQLTYMFGTGPETIKRIIKEV